MKSKQLEQHKARLVAALNAYKEEHGITLHGFKTISGNACTEAYIQQILKGKASFETTLAFVELMPLVRLHYRAIVKA